MTDQHDFQAANSQWFLCDLRYEGMVGDKMRENFSLHLDSLPHPLEILLQRLTERETSSGQRISARTARWREGDGQV